MALIQNTIKSSKLSVADTDAWIAANKPDGADKDLPIADLDSRTKNNAYLFESNDREQLPYRRKRKVRANTIDKNQRIDDFVKKIKNGDMVRADQYATMSKAALSALLFAVRGQCDVLTVRDGHNAAVGWVGRKTFFERFDHE